MSDEDYFETYQPHYITRKRKREILEGLKTTPIQNLNPEWCKAVIEELLPKIDVMGEDEYDSNFGDDRICKCGHPYHRHFDGYENNAPVGCKYCHCDAFHE